jgi:hypothetical protein
MFAPSRRARTPAGQPAGRRRYTGFSAAPDSELYPRHMVLTVNEADFRIYRRNKRETIPILCPPGVRG